MRYIAKEDAQEFQNSASCIVFEYGGDSNISGGVAHINGRYPESGWVMNRTSKEIVYVISGSGSLTIKKSASVDLHEGDMVLIDILEPYYFEGMSLRLFMATTPPWTPEQHIHVG